MIGCYDKADKCSLVAKDHKFGGYSLIVARLKNHAEIGEKTEKDNIGKVLCHLHFCTLKSAKVFLKAVQALVDEWEEEQT